MLFKKEANQFHFKSILKDLMKNKIQVSQLKDPTFDNGETAFSYLSSVNTLPLIIISDINMLKLDGFERCRKLKQMQPCT